MWFALHPRDFVRLALRAGLPQVANRPRKLAGIAEAPRRELRAGEGVSRAEFLP